MVAITCDVCGSNSLTMTDDGQFSVCDFCGTKHTLERVRAKVQKIKGVVEITKGEAEKERLLDNINTFIQLNELSKADNLFSELLNSFPNSFECRIAYIKFLFLKLDQRFSKKDYETCILPSQIISVFRLLLDEIGKLKKLNFQCVEEIENLWREHNRRNAKYMEELVTKDYPLYDLWNLLMLEHEKSVGVHASDILQSGLGTIITQYSLNAHQLASNCNPSKLMNILYPATVCYCPTYDPFISKRFNLDKLEKREYGWYRTNHSLEGGYIEEILSIDYLSKNEVICFAKFVNPDISWCQKQVYIRFSKSYNVNELAVMMNNTLTPQEKRQAD